jgi:NAD(P)-dependent dehydrogenase (short-subunit alcohol dehydrogenase family)
MMGKRAIIAGANRGGWAEAIERLARDGSQRGDFGH